MNATMRKRIFASVLAGTMALSVPMTAGATADGQGGTIGSGSVPKPDYDKFYDVVLPTNTLSNVNFIIDATYKITGGQYVIEDDVKAKYDDKANVYFKRTDFSKAQFGTSAALPEGSVRKFTDDNTTPGAKEAPVARYADEIWGNVINTRRADGASFEYGNTSNWMVLKNKSAQSAVVELSASWRGLGDQIEIVDSEYKLTSSTKPQMYMAIQASTGHTDGLTFDGDGNLQYTETRVDIKNASNVKIGDKIAKINYTPLNTIDIVGKTLLTSANDRIKDGGVMDTISLVHKYGDNPAENGLPTKGEGETVYLSYCVPTVYQGFNDERYVDTFVKDNEDENGKVIGLNQSVANDAQAFYDKTVIKDGSIQKFVLWDNRTEKVYGQDGTNDKAYDNNYDVYPTFGFRLYGKVNAIKAWENLTVAPTINLRWRVTLGTPKDAGVKNVPSLSDNTIDIMGSTESLQVTAYLNDGTKGTETPWVNSSATLDSIDWLVDGTPVELWNSVTGSVKIDTDSAFGGGDRVEILNVERPMHDADKKQQENYYNVWIRQLAIYNWSYNGYFNKGAAVVLRFNFTMKNGNSYSCNLNIKDSYNIIGQN